MPILKSKMSKSAYVLIAILICVIIALPILHLVGVIDLSFIGDGFTGILVWGSEGVLNGVLLLGGFFAAGALFYYALKKYILGTQVPATAGVYNPIGQTVSPAAQKDDETVVTQ